MNQLTRAKQVSAKYHKMFADLVDCKDELQRILANEENDGSIGKTDRVNIATVVKHTTRLLSALLFVPEAKTRRNR